MRRSLIAALAVTAVAVIPLVPASAGATAARGTPDKANPHDTHCLAAFDLTLSPGISMTPSSGTFTSGGETGTSTCDGTINGYQPTGVGSRGEAGRYGVGGPSSCMKPEGVSEWTIVFTIPTTGGAQHLEFPVRGPYGPLENGGLFGGTFTGEGMYGKYKITILEGDCVTTPITKIHLDCDEWVVAER